MRLPRVGGEVGVGGLAVGPRVQAFSIFHPDDYEARPPLLRLAVDALPLLRRARRDAELNLGSLALVRVCVSAAPARESDVSPRLGGGAGRARAVGRPVHVVGPDAEADEACSLSLRVQSQLPHSLCEDEYPSSKMARPSRYTPFPSISPPYVSSKGTPLAVVGEPRTMRFFPETRCGRSE